MPVYEGREMLQDEHFKARQLIQNVNGINVGLMPVCFDGERNQITRSAPELGADNERLLSNLNT